MGMQDYGRERGSSREGREDQSSRFRDGGEYDSGTEGYRRQDEFSGRGMDDDYETRNSRSGWSGSRGYEGMRRGDEPYRGGDDSYRRGQGSPRRTGGVEWSDWSNASEGRNRGEYRGERGYRGYRGERFNEEGSGDSYGASGSSMGNYGTNSYSTGNYGSNRGMGGSRGNREYGYGGSGRSYSEGRGNRASYAGLGPKGYRRSDERIEEEINEQLMQHPDIDPSEIEVKVQNGEVTLTGTVDTREAKRLAEDIAEASSGVDEVQNQIRVNKNKRNENTSEREVQRHVDKEGKRSASSGASSGTRTTSSSSPSIRSSQSGEESKNEATT